MSNSFSRRFEPFRQPLAALGYMLSAGMTGMTFVFQSVGMIDVRIAMALIGAAGLFATIATVILRHEGTPPRAPRIKQVLDAETRAILLVTPTRSWPIDTLVALYVVEGGVEMLVAIGFVAREQADGLLQIEVFETGVVLAGPLAQLRSKEMNLRQFRVRSEIPRTYIVGSNSRPEPPDPPPTRPKLTKTR